MSNIEKFEELLRSDEELQEKLRAAASAFEGDRNDERAVFDATFAPLSVEAGFPITFDDVVAYAETIRELDRNELETVAGGKDRGPYNACVLFGGGTEEIAPDACIKEFFGAGACKYVGVGFIHWY